MNKHCYPCKECKSKYYRDAGKRGGQANVDKGTDFAELARKRWAKHRSKVKAQS